MENCKKEFCYSTKNENKRYEYIDKKVKGCVKVCIQHYFLYNRDVIHICFSTSHGLAMENGVFLRIFDVFLFRYNTKTFGELLKHHFRRSLKPKLENFQFREQTISGYQKHQLKNYCYIRIFVESCNINTFSSHILLLNPVKILKDECFTQLVPKKLIWYSTPYQKVMLYKYFLQPSYIKTLQSSL